MPGGGFGVKSDLFLLGKDQNRGNFVTHKLSCGNFAGKD